MNRSIVYMAIIALVLLSFASGCAKQAEQAAPAQSQESAPAQESLTAETQLFDEQELEDTSDDLDELIADLENLTV